MRVRFAWLMFWRLIVKVASIVCVVMPPLFELISSGRVQVDNSWLLELHLLKYHLFEGSFLGGVRFLAPTNLLAPFTVVRTIVLLLSSKKTPSPMVFDTQNIELLPFLHFNRRKKWASLLMNYTNGKCCFLAFHSSTERLINVNCRYFMNHVGS